MENKFNLKPQDHPFTINLEPVEGCNLGCSFCGLRGMREKGTKPWNLMTLDTAVRVASELKRVGWPVKLVFANHGEPTINPQLAEILRVFRTYLPKTIMHVISNGYGIAHSQNPLGYIAELKDAGLNHLILDNYSDHGDWSKVVAAVGDTEKVIYMTKGVPLYSKSKDFDILVLPPIQKESIGITRRLANHAGAAFPKDHTHDHKRCAMPFRELSVRWDGNVAICCDDFRGEYPIANVMDMPIEELWNHPRFQAARIILYNKERSFNPCNGCTNLSMRVGFLPDITGQETLPEPTDEIREYARAVTRDNKPYATIVKRPWEKKEDVEE